MIGDRFEHICHLHNTENFRIPYWTHYVTETFRPLNYSNKDFQQHVDIDVTRCGVECAWSDNFYWLSSYEKVFIRGGFWKK